MTILCFLILQLQVFTGSLNKYIDNFKSKSDNQGINISVSIRDLSNGSEVYQYNSAMNLPPASTLKLLTTATAFRYLGSDFKFETMLYANGLIRNGNLNGDLVIEGIGDPTLGSSKFKNNPMEQIYLILNENRIRNIKGEIKIKNNDDITFPLNWLITDLGNYYGAFPNNFNFLENLYTVYFVGGSKIGDPVRISNIYPYNPEWKIRNEVKTGEVGSGDQVNILNLPFSNDIQMVGTVPLNSKKFAVKGAIPKVDQIFTDSLSHFLKQKNIMVENIIHSDHLKPIELGSIESPEVYKIAKETNFRSVNFFADGLANYMWQSESENYDKFIKAFWAEEGLNLNGHNIYDGSGLAPQNSFSSRSMTLLLYKMSDHDDFIASVPTVGKDGTVANLGKDTYGKIKAKSGTISGTRNYSGYFTSIKNKKYSFSVYVNGFTSSQSKTLTPFFNEIFSRMLSI